MGKRFRRRPPHLTMITIEQLTAKKTELQTAMEQDRAAAQQHEAAAKQLTANATAKSGAIQVIDQLIADATPPSKPQA